MRNDSIAGHLKEGATETTEFGLTRVGIADGEMVYYNKDDDRTFMFITCPRKSQASFFCEYEIILNNRYIAKAVFIDFRFAGGREFLDRRIAAVRKALCPYIKCD